MNAVTESLNEAIEQSIPERFEKVVRLFPHRVAVKSGDRSLTYEELNQAANKIARTIIEKRGQESEPIALLFEPGVDVIAAIFGVLKAGKFYVALDPTFPQDRINNILDDSGSPLIITNDSNIDLARVLKSATHDLLNTNEIDGSLACENLCFPLSPDAAVMITYTSGSTGAPKGVVKSHAFSLDNARFITDAIGVNSNDRVTLLHRISSSAHEADLYTSLLNGAALLPFDLKSEGIHGLATWLRKNQITILHLVSSLFRQFVNLLPPSEKFPNLRMIRLSSEPLSQLDFDLYDRIFGRETCVVFGLGTSEAGALTYAKVGHGFACPKEGSPAGYPRPGKQILLLDENGREVAPGEVGEIAVKGRNLNAVYWRRPDLTNQKFVLDPTGGHERIYLTGDLGRRLPDGFLIHLGRKDLRVKIRGHAVEPGEIEAALLEHVAIKEAVIIAQDDLRGEKRLVAYVVSSQEPTPTTRELRNFLKQKIPEYMLPSVFVPLDALPLTLNGKVDRQALPKPDSIRPELKETFVAPRSPTEKMLAGICAKLLGLEQVGVTDNFFDLGGNSLLAMRFFSEIEKEFKKCLPLSSLFEDPTIGYLASLLCERNLLTRWPSIVAIQSRGSKLPFFCVHHLFGDVFCYGLLAHYLGQDQPFYALQARGLDGVEKPTTDVMAMAAHYIQEIRTIQPQGPYALGGYSSGGVVAFEMARQLRAKGEAVTMVALFDSLAVGQGKFSRSWSFLRNLAADLASWLIGLSHLSPQQCLYLVRFRVRTLKNLVAAIFRAPHRFHETLAANAIEEWGDLLQFSEHHRQIALAQSRALRAYRPQVYPNRLTLFRAARTLPLYYSHGPDRGWGKLAAGGLDIRVVPGTHFTILREPHVQFLAEELRACLDKDHDNGLLKSYDPSSPLD